MNKAVTNKCWQISVWTGAGRELSARPRR